MYKDVDGPTKPLGDLNVACSRIPVHVIFGGINDFMCVSKMEALGYILTSYSMLLRERKIQDALTNPKSGRRFASITRVEGAGHLVCFFHFLCTIDVWICSIK